MPEAEPLVERFGLERDRGHRGRRVFSGSEIRLIVSGIGSEAAATAVAELAGPSDQRRTEAWLNVGLAGHREREVGEAFLVHRVESVADGGVWFPMIAFEPSLPTASLVTVERPEVEYPKTVLYDMEGAGFVRAAQMRATSELVQLVKIVSDNRATSIDTVTASIASRLVAARLDEIAAIASTLAELSRELAARRSGPTVEPWLDRWHFTVTERRQLERLLARLAALDPAGAPTAADLAAERSARDVLGALADFLDEHPVDYRRPAVTASRRQPR
jgi:hypothetical protein